MDPNFLNIACKDQVEIVCRHFKASLENDQSTILIINSATAVSQTIYHHFAEFLALAGFEVFTYDYRGIARSRPKRLKGFAASFITWGKLDFPTVLKHAQNLFPKHRILVLGHSIGGTLLGMTKDSHKLNGAITIGAQTAYYKDWGKGKINRYILWHMFLPIVTQVFGYFPGKKLGLTEDVPKGVIDEWHARRKQESFIAQMQSSGIKSFYHEINFPLVSICVADDPIATLKAVSRLHNYFEQAPKELKQIWPSEYGVPSIGHFGFSSRKFENSIWPYLLSELRHINST